jgi:hypothetical protein
MPLYVFICTEAEFLDELQTKVLRVFLLAIHSHLYSFALRFLYFQTHATSYNFYGSAPVHPIAYVCQRGSFNNIIMTKYCRCLCAERMRLICR